MAGSGGSSYWGMARRHSATDARVSRRETNSSVINSTVNKMVDASGENTAAEPFANTPETAPPERSATPSAQMAPSIPKKEGA